MDLNNNSLAVRNSGKTANTTPAFSDCQINRPIDFAQKDAQTVIAISIICFSARLNMNLHAVRIRSKITNKRIFTVEPFDRTFDESCFFIRQWKGWERSGV